MEGLLFSVQFHSSYDDSRDGVDAEVFPVSVTCSSLQEAIADLSIHPLVRVCCMHLVNRQAWRLLLHGGQRLSVCACVNLLPCILKVDCNRKVYRWFLELKSKSGPFALQTFGHVAAEKA